MKKRKLGSAIAFATAIMLVSTCIVPVSAQDVTSNAENQQFVFAYRLLQKGDSLAAIEAFDKYLGSFPNGEKRGDAQYFRALLAWQDGDRKTALKLLANVPPPRLVPAHKLNFLRGRIYVEQGQHEESLKSLEKIDASKLEAAEQASVLYLLGVAYKGANNLVAAEKSLAGAGKLESTVRPRSLLELGRVQALNRKPKDAIASLEACLKLGRSDVNAEAARLAGDLSYELKDYKEALRFYNIVLAQYQSSQHFAPSIIQSLWSLLYTKQYNVLLANFEQYKAKLEIGDRAIAWYLAGRAFQETGKHKEAVAMFDVVVAANIGSSIEDQILYRMGESQFETGDYTAMGITLGRLRRNHPKSKYLSSADYLLVQANLKQGKAAESVKQLTAIIDQEPAHPYRSRALLDRAQIHTESEKLAEAVKDYEAYLEMAAKPDAKLAGVNQTRVRLNDLYYRLGQYDKASAMSDTLLKTVDVSPVVQQEALFRKALVLIQKEQYTSAIGTFDRLMKDHPKNAFAAQVYYYRGLMILGERPEDAVKELANAVADRQLPDELRANALLLISMQQRDAGKDDEAAKTLFDLEKIITLDGMRVYDMIWLGRHYIKTNPRSVFRFLQPLIEGKRTVEPREKAEALYLVGVALKDASVKKYELALRTFQEVEAMGHGYGLHARLEVARTQALMNKTDDALQTYRGLMIAKNSTVAATALLESARVRRSLADESKVLKDDESAKKYYKDAYNALYRLTVLYSVKSLSPLPEMAHIERAELAPLIDKSEDAALSFKELKERFPDGPFAEYVKAIELIGKERTIEAATLLRKLRQTKLIPELATRVHDRLRELEKGN